MKTKKSNSAVGIILMATLGLYAGGRALIESLNKPVDLREKWRLERVEEEKKYNTLRDSVYAAADRDNDGLELEEYQDLLIHAGFSERWVYSTINKYNYEIKMDQFCPAEDRLRQAMKKLQEEKGKPRKEREKPKLEFGIVYDKTKDFGDRMMRDVVITAAPYIYRPQLLRIVDYYSKFGDGKGTIDEVYVVDEHQRHPSTQINPGSELYNYAQTAYIQIMEN